MLPRSALPCILVASLVLGAGCAATAQEELAERDVIERTLRADIQLLETEIEALQDSLQFYDDIESGQFARDQRLLRDEITALEYRLAVARDGGRTVATLLADDLFEPASARLTEAGRTALDAVADTLTSAHAGALFRVEGHADNTPLGGALQEQYPTNWELAAARAAAVARYLLDTETGLDAHQMAVVSRGDTRPVATNSTAVGRAQNRRVQILVLAPCGSERC
ncbi:MAG: OmpA family protein [Bacteroidota bacterium]